MNEGWIKLHRGIKDHWLWGSPNKVYWWIDILLTVNYEDKKVLIGNTLVECKRGQSVQSLEAWAKQWNVSKKCVKNFFELLANDSMIVTENIKVSTRLTVCNYETYQAPGNGLETAGKRDGNAMETTGLHKQERKEIKEVKNKKAHICDVPEKLQNIEGFSQAWEEWLTYRRERRLTVTPSCLNKQLKWLEAREKPIDVINQSITNGWQGLFDLKEGFKSAAIKPNTRQLIDRDKYTDGLIFDNRNQNKPAVQKNGAIQCPDEVPGCEPY